MSQFWTSHDDELLLARRRQRVSFYAIAYELGRTLDSCRHRYAHLSTGTAKDWPDMEPSEDDWKAMCERGSRQLLQAMTGQVA